MLMLFSKQAKPYYVAERSIVRTNPWYPRDRLICYDTLKQKPYVLYQRNVFKVTYISLCLFRTDIQIPVNLF